MRGEKLLSLSAASVWLEEELGLKRNRQSLYRWLYYGVQGTKLEACSVCGQWYVTKEGIRRFLAATTRAHSAESGAQINELAL